MSIEKRWPNYIKWFCLVFIFLNHSEVYSGFRIPFYSSYISPFYVNAFFFISGYFLIGRIINQLNAESNLKSLNVFYKRNLLNIIFKLIIPAILFSLIEYLPSCLIKNKPFCFTDFLVKTIGGGTYWFVSALVVAELLLILLPFTRIKNVWFYFGVCVCFYICGCLLVKYNFFVIEQYPNFPWSFKNGLLSFLFIGFGGLFFRYESSINKFFKLPVTLVLLACYIVLVTFISEPINLPEFIKTFNIFESFNGLLAVMILIYLFKLIKTNSKLLLLINFEGRHSIGLYFLSGAMPAVFSAIICHIIPYQSVFLLVCVFVLSFAFANLINYLFVRFVPFLFDFRLFKKRT